jgi:methionine sulfoxide reductase heme-binding subunit
MRGWTSGASIDAVSTRAGPVAVGRRRAGAGRPARRTRTLVTVGAWATALAPLLLLGLETALGRLGANPIEALTHRTGWWALTLLLLTLAVTPVRRLTGFDPLIRARRPLGVFAFLYATLHLLVYFVLDQDLAVAYLVEDVLERPFITVGFAAWLLLLPLALTSTRGWIRRLGRRWTLLHRLIYPAAGLGVLHFAWGVKADLREPILFATALLLLLAFRLTRALRSPTGSATRRTGAGTR